MVSRRFATVSRTASCRVDHVASKAAAPVCTYAFAGLLLGRELLVPPVQVGRRCRPKAADDDPQAGRIRGQRQLLHAGEVRLGFRAVDRQVLAQLDEQEPVGLKHTDHVHQATKRDRPAARRAGPDGSGEADPPGTGTARPSRNSRQAPAGALQVSGAMRAMRADHHGASCPDARGDRPLRIFDRLRRSRSPTPQAGPASRRP